MCFFPRQGASEERGKQYFRGKSIFNAQKRHFCGNLRGFPYGDCVLWVMFSVILATVKLYKGRMIP